MLIDTKEGVENDVDHQLVKRISDHVVEKMKDTAFRTNEIVPDKDGGHQFVFYVEAEAYDETLEAVKGLEVFKGYGAVLVERKMNNTITITLKAFAIPGVREVQHTTAEEIAEAFGTMQLIVITPRYTPSKFAAVFGSNVAYFPEMVDWLTSGDSMHAIVDSLFTGTPWYPYGEGETIQEAINDAVARFNTIDPQYKREALALVHNSSSNWNPELNVNMKPLILTGEAW